MSISSSTIRSLFSKSARLNRLFSTFWMLVSLPASELQIWQSPVCSDGTIGGEVFPGRPGKIQGVRTQGPDGFTGQNAGICLTVVKEETGMRNGQKKITAALLCGLLGCACFGGGDWLMLYGDTAHSGTLSWLTAGAAQIAPWRNSLAMALAFPGIILYGIALFSIAGFLTSETAQKRYQGLTVFSLTPWLCLHLFYIMILYGFAWMSGNGYESAALSVGEALFAHFAWLVPISEIFMLPPYFYWGWLVLRGKSVFPRRLALFNPLIFYGILKLLTTLMPDSPFRLAFTNGLMSESMALWFGSILIYNALNIEGRKRYD